MKKIPLLFLTVISLSFSNCKNPNASTPSVSTAKDAPSAVQTAAMAGAKIAYVNIDSLQDKYVYFKQQKASFEQKERNLASSIESKGMQLQKDMVAFQQKAQTGTVPPAQLQQEEKSLMQRQQSLGADRDRRAKDLMDETAKFNEELQKKLTSILANLQKEKGFDFVVSYSKNGGSPFLYVNEKLDVTNEVVAVLNAEKKQ